WALTRYDDVVRASIDPETFSSSEGVVIPKNPVSGRRPPLHYDPPEHTVYRQALNPAFTKRRARALEPEIQSIVHGLLDPILAAGGGDMVEAFTSPLSTLTFLAMLNVSPEQVAALQEHRERFEAAQIAEDRETAEEESLLLYRYCRGFVDERLADPQDPHTDIVSALAQARPNGEPVDAETITGSIRQMIIAAHIAPTCALASILRHLALYPDLQAELRRRPKTIPEVLEELLRLYTPNQGFARTVHRDVEVAGISMRKGDLVALVLTSANRDETVFEAADQVVPSRRQHHLAFGHGPHSCIGQHLARLETRVALEGLLRRTSSLAMDGEPTWMSWPVYGPKSLPMRIVPA
ncbi:MAG: cytochrome P450, partial [Acidimicrobiales bacterium]